MLQAYVRQKANSKWFSIFKIPLGTYSLAGKDSAKWINRTLKNIGEKPVVYDTLMANRSLNDLTTAMHNMGYMHATAEIKTKVRGKKIKAIYLLHPKDPYYINSVKYDIKDSVIAKLLVNKNMRYPFKPKLLSGSKFTVDVLDAERKNITNFLLDNGYYKFHKDYIIYSADSARNSKDINIVLHLLPYRVTSSSPDTLHPCYTINKINFLSGDTVKIHLRNSVLRYTTALEEGKLYNNSELQNTYNKFARLQAVRFTNISFREHPDTTLLDCDIQLSTNKPNTLSFQPEGTNTAGDLGAAASLTWENRNLFKGSELFSIQLRGAFEAITGLEGYQNQNYEEYNIEGKLQFPRF